MRVIALVLTALLLMGFGHRTPVGPITDSNGWSVLTPSSGSGTCVDSSGTYTGTCIVYVDGSAGNDGTCASSPQPVNQSGVTPCLTIAHAMTLMRTGKPDWMLLKKGTSFGPGDNFGNLTVSGRSDKELMVFSAYPTNSAGTRPLIKSNGNGSNGVISATGGATGGDYIALVGLDFYAITRDPNGGSFVLSDANLNPSGIDVENPFHFWLVEDCRFRSYASAVDFGVSPNSGAATAVLSIRRNVIADTYAIANVNSIGLFVSQINNVLIEENVIDSNGWNPTLSALTQVTITQANPAVVTWSGNNLANDSQVTFQTSGGGITAGTTYWVVSNGVDGAGKFRISLTQGGSAISTSAGLVSPQNSMWMNPAKQTRNRNVYIHHTTGTKMTFRGNVSTNSSSDAIQARTGGTVSNNYFDSNPISYHFGVCPACDTPAGVTLINASGSNNVTIGANDLNFFTFYGQGVQLQNSSGPKVTIANDIVAHTSTSGTNGFGVQLASDTDHIAVTNSIYCDMPSQTTVLNQGTSNTDSGNTKQAANCNGLGFPDPTRTAATYNAQLSDCASLPGGCTSSLSAFLTSARAQSKDNWRTELMAAALNTYVRAGFGL